MTKVIYKIISNHEVPELSKIEKSNITAEITLADTIKSYEDNKKGIKGIEAEVAIKKALIENVEHFHPEVKTIPEETQIACHTYYEAKKFLAMAESHLAEFAEAQKDLKEEIEEIEKQTGLSKMTEEKKSEIMAGIKAKVDAGYFEPKKKGSNTKNKR